MLPLPTCNLDTTEAADIATVDVERYKRLAVQQEKSITALQARNQETEARARDGAVNADMVEQLRNERDQMSMLVRAPAAVFPAAHLRLHTFLHPS